MRFTFTGAVLMRCLTNHFAVCFLVAHLVANDASAASIAVNGILDHFDPNTGVTTDTSGYVSQWDNQADGNRSVVTTSTHTSVVSGPNGQQLIHFNTPDGQGHLPYESPGDSAMSDGYTVTTLVRLDSTTNNYQRLHTSDTDSHALYLNHSTRQMTVKATPATTRPSSSWDVAFSPADYAVVTARLEPTKQELYFNNQLVSATASAVSGYDLSNDEFRIGNSVVGDIGHVLVYDNQHTIADQNETYLALAQLYGTTSDRPAVYLPFDGNLANLGTSSAAAVLNNGGGSSSYVSSPASPQALELNGTGATSNTSPHVAVDYQFADSGTIALSYKPNGFFNYQSIIDQPGDANDWEAWVYGDGRLAFRTGDNDGEGFVDFDLDNLSGANEWYHVAMTWERDGSSVNTQLYVDGVLRDTGSGNWLAPQSSFYIGSGNDGNTPSNAAFDEFAVYDRLLTDLEIAALAGGSAVAVPEPSTLALAGLVLIVVGMFTRRWS